MKFSSAVDKTSVINSDGTLKSGVLTFAQVGVTGTVVVTDSTSLATLSADKMTLTVTAETGSFNNVKFVMNLLATTAIRREYVPGTEVKKLLLFLTVSFQLT